MSVLLKKATALKSCLSRTIVTENNGERLKRSQRFSCGACSCMQVFTGILENVFKLSIHDFDRDLLYCVSVA